MNISGKKHNLIMYGYLVSVACGLGVIATRADAQNAGDDDLGNRVMTALHTDPYLNDRHVTVSVEKGSVVLGGFVSRRLVRCKMRWASRCRGLPVTHAWSTIWIYNWVGVSEAVTEALSTCVGCQRSEPCGDGLNRLIVEGLRHTAHDEVVGGVMRQIVVKARQPRGEIRCVLPAQRRVRLHIDRWRPTFSAASAPWRDS